MTRKAFDISEFMEAPRGPVAATAAGAETVEETESDGSDEIGELDVQRAVVEAFAAEKAEFHEKMVELEKTRAKEKEAYERLAATLKEKEALLASREDALAKSEARAAKLSDEVKALKEANAKLERQIGEKLEETFNLQERNPNALALLDRDVDLPDRFPGEARDHVIEVVREARDRAEAEGRIRRAQVLESVLVSNEPNGNLATRRAKLEKIFKDNGNLLSGPVMAELDKLGISYKNGEEYLLAKDILLRTY